MRRERGPLIIASAFALLAASQAFMALGVLLSGFHHE
jgi:hypothetical protein